MEKAHYEHPEDACRNLLKKDYMNEYNSFFDMLTDVNARPYPPRRLSERYPNMTFAGLPFKVSEEEKVIISSLDELATRAFQLLNNPSTNRKLLFEIAIEASKLCERPDLMNLYKEGIE